jgi:hypothetical protein
MDEMVSGVKAAQSVALGGYGEFLQNAEVGAFGYPERCSGLVYGVLLGHGVGGCAERIGGRGRREVVELGRLGVC